MNSLCVLYDSYITMTYFKVAYLKSHSALPKFLKLIEKEKVKPSMEVVGDGKQINGI